MSTLSEREAYLRQALHAAVDGIEPHPGGLERIRARAGRPRPVPLAWAEAVWTDVRLQAPGALRTLLEQTLGVLGAAWERFGPRRGMPGGRTARTLSWLRPVAALGAMVFIVAAGAYVAINAQQAIFPSSSNSLHTAGNGVGAHHHRAGRSGNARSQPATGAGNPSNGTSTSASCRPTRAGSGSPSPSRSTGQSQSPSPTPSASSPGTPSPTPSVSGTANPTSSTSAGTATTAVTKAGARSRPAAASPTTSPCPRRKKASHTPTPVAAGDIPPVAIGLGRLNDDV